jgi:thiamine pyrophosphate-dependent acetolactate synthase large subunit-like protein
VQRSSELRRTASLAELIDDHRRYLIVCGLGTAAFDAARLTGNGTNLFPIDGAMGCAVPVGLGLALARPDRQVLVMTGDGELLMSLGSLATAAVQAPPNLSILCIDNGVWGLTGEQPTHTSFHADLTAVAAGCGIEATFTVSRQDDIPQGRALLADSSRLTFVRLVLESEPAEPFPFDRDGPTARRRFRDALAAAA